VVDPDGSSAYYTDTILTRMSYDELEFTLDGNIALSTEACHGSEVVLTVEVSGAQYDYINYRWYENEIMIFEDGDTKSLTISADSAINNDYRYHCMISNYCGQLISNLSTLLVERPPVVTTDPAGQSVCTGTTTAFHIEAEGDVDTYQWEHKSPAGKDGSWETIIGTTNPKYSDFETHQIRISSPDANLDEYQYRCRVYNSTCDVSDYSDTSILKIRIPPSNISVTPGINNICNGDMLTLSVEADGSTPFTYEWLKREGVTTGYQSDNNYIIDAIEPAEAGNYYCKVSNSCSPGVPSTDAEVGVMLPPAISSQPQDVTLCEGSQPSVAFTATATGNGLSYQWEYMVDDDQVWTNLHNNSVFTGVTTSTLTVNSTDDTLNQYAFRCIIAGLCDPSDTTDIALLTINTGPVITEHPDDVVACEGYDVTLSVTATGTQPLLYRWKQGGVSITDWETTSSLHLSGISSGEADFYNVLVDNMCSSIPVESDN